MLSRVVSGGVDAGLVLVHKDVRLMADVFAERKSVSLERKFTRTAEEGDSDAFVG